MNQDGKIIRTKQAFFVCVYSLKIFFGQQLKIINFQNKEIKNKYNFS